ncbi:MAG: hypothetical protein M3063_00405 [Actinomycetota bacterium]|nr:hypothetical protein [Actinomycetota bacterium]
MAGKHGSTRLAGLGDRLGAQSRRRDQCPSHQPTVPTSAGMSSDVVAAVAPLKPVGTSGALTPMTGMSRLAPEDPIVDALSGSWSAVTR